MYSKHVALLYHVATIRSTCNFSSIFYRQASVTLIVVFRLSLGYYFSIPLIINYKDLIVKKKWPCLIRSP